MTGLDRTARNRVVSKLANRVEGFHEPQQVRSRRTLERMARATEELLAERGPAGVTVQAVVARAGASVGAFYTRFESRDDAVAFVRERSWESARAGWREFLDPDAWKAVSAEVVIAEVIRRFCRVLLAEDRPSRGFYLDLLVRRDDDVLQRVRRLDGEIARLVGRLLEQRTRGLEHPPAREDVEEGFRRVISGVRDHLLFGSRHADRSLILSLTRMYAALLRVEGPASYGRLLEMCASAQRARAAR